MVQPVPYDGLPPNSYCCTQCEAKGVKLWRQYQMFADKIDLLCLTCAEKNQGKQLTAESDSIGWLVPAVPTEDGATFWGYASVPDAGVLWWHKLPPEIVQSDIERVGERRAR